MTDTDLAEVVELVKRTSTITSTLRHCTEAETCSEPLLADCRTAIQEIETFMDGFVDRLTLQMIQSR